MQAAAAPQSMNSLHYIKAKVNLLVTLKVPTYTENIASGIFSIGLRIHVQST